MICPLVNWLVGFGLNLITSFQIFAYPEDSRGTQGWIFFNPLPEIHSQFTL